MTRLIDADKLPNIYTATHQEMIMAFEEAPTVEAIPIWFIKGCQDDHLIFITELLNAWEKRKEE